MGPTKLTINNNSGLSLYVMNNQAGNIGGCANGESFTYNFDSSFTNNTNAVRFCDPKTPGSFRMCLVFHGQVVVRDSIQDGKHLSLLVLMEILMELLSLPTLMVGLKWNLGILWQTEVKLQLTTRKLKNKNEFNRVNSLCSTPYLGVLYTVLFSILVF